MVSLVLTTAVGTAEFPLFQARSDRPGGEVNAAIQMLDPRLQVRVGGYTVQPRDFVVGIVLVVMAVRFLSRR